MDNNVDSKDINVTNGTIVPYKVYTLEETADILKVNRKTVYQLQQDDKLPKKKIGRGYRFLGEDILRAMRSDTSDDIKKDKK